MDKLLSRAELAELLGIPVQTLANWVSAGKGPGHILVGWHARYRPSDVERWLESRSREAAACEDAS